MLQWSGIKPAMSLGYACNCQCGMPVIVTMNGGGAATPMVENQQVPYICVVTGLSPFLLFLCTWWQHTLILQSDGPVLLF